MRKLALICVFCLALVVNAAGQQQADYTSADEIQRDLTFLLLKKDINDVTKQLERLKLLGCRVAARRVASRPLSARDRKYDPLERR